MTGVQSTDLSISPGPDHPDDDRYGIIAISDFTIENEGVIVLSIDLLRREIARGRSPITFQS